MTRIRSPLRQPLALDEKGTILRGAHSEEDSNYRRQQRVLESISFLLKELVEDTECARLRDSV